MPLTEQEPLPNNDSGSPYSKWLNRRLGGYTLIQYIGGGVYGTAFKAYHQITHRTVVIKISKPIHLPVERVKEIIRQHYRALTELNHPGICRILDIQLLADHELDTPETTQFYTVQEYINGQPLSELPAPITQNQVRNYVAIWVGVCRAVDYLHQYRYTNTLGIEEVGVYHSDLNPSNILIKQSSGQPLIIDFPYLGFELEKRKHDVPLPIRTRRFMPPEQQERGLVNPKTEIFALGMILNALLTGSRAFFQEMATDSANPPPNQLTNTLPETHPVPKLLHQLIAKATHTDPLSRYHSVQDMLADVPLSWQNRHQQPTGLSLNRRQLIGWGVGGLFTVSVFIGWWNWPSDRIDDWGTDTSRSKRGGVVASLADTLPLHIQQDRYYALLIGVNEYKDGGFRDLDRPIDDAKALSEVLVKFYRFTPSQIRLLENPTRDDIQDAFDAYMKTIGLSDNLLIFYAGHGMYDSELQQGFWLPADADKHMRSRWLSNSTIREYINGLPARHILLISDACYSGSFLLSERGEPVPSGSIAQAYKLPSRKAITSSSMEVVPDQSLFADRLVATLQKNRRSYLSASSLFEQFAQGVADENSRQLPQFGHIKGQNQKDKGGDFIFVHR